MQIGLVILIIVHLLRPMSVFLVPILYRGAQRNSELLSAHLLRPNIEHLQMLLLKRYGCFHCFMNLDFLSSLHQCCSVINLRAIHLDFQSHLAFSDNACPDRSPLCARHGLMGHIICSSCQYWRSTCGSSHETIVMAMHEASLEQDWPCQWQTHLLGTY